VEKDFWLKPYGRDNVDEYNTKLTEISASLYVYLKKAYPINEVPKHLLDDLNRLCLSLAESEEKIQLFITDVGEDLTIYKGKQ